MKWLIWPRQYGKTYQVQKWLAEDIANRVILTSNEQLARIRRRDLEDAFTALNPPSHMIAEYRKMLKAHVVSFRSWQNMRGMFPPTIEVAVDGIDDIVGPLFGGNVKIITGTGRNSEPDPVAASKADEFHAKFAHLIPEESETVRQVTL